MSLETDLKSFAIALGFSRLGIAAAGEAESFPAYEAWLDLGMHGEMAYLERRRAERRHPQAILESVRRVIMLAMPYGDLGESSMNRPANHGRVARYAQGPDYHPFMWGKLNEIQAWLEGRIDCETAAVTDTAPLLERDFARRAGLGWIGKNTMLIDPELGSFTFLGAIVTNAELTPDVPFTKNHCGTCTACLDVCPTDALPSPGVLDARKCISYQTIERRTIIPDDEKPGLGDWLFGCDLCQDVCPWNRFSTLENSTFPQDPSWLLIDCVELLVMTEKEFQTRFKGTSFKRTKRVGLQRNAAIVLGNTGDRRSLPVLEKALAHESDIVRDAARWAMERILQR